MTDIETHSDEEQENFDALIKLWEIGVLTLEQLKSRLIDLKCDYTDLIIEDLELELKIKEHTEKVDLMKKMESVDSETCIKLLGKIWGVDAST